jgi:hypothetical protein
MRRPVAQQDSKGPIGEVSRCRRCNNVLKTYRSAWSAYDTCVGMQMCLTNNNTDVASSWSDEDSNGARKNKSSITAGHNIQENLASR